MGAILDEYPPEWDNEECDDVCNDEVKHQDTREDLYEWESSTGRDGYLDYSNYHF